MVREVWEENSLAGVGDNCGSPARTNWGCEETKPSTGEFTRPVWRYERVGHMIQYCML